VVVRSFGILDDGRLQLNDFGKHHDLQLDFDDPAFENNEKDEGIFNFHYLAGFS
jgi:hypothetical protein